MEISDAEALKLHEVLLKRLQEQWTTEKTELRNKIYFLEHEVHKKNEDIEELTEIILQQQRELNALRDAK